MGELAESSAQNSSHSFPDGGKLWRAVGPLISLRSLDQELTQDFYSEIKIELLFSTISLKTLKRSGTILQYNKSS